MRRTLTAIAALMMMAMAPAGLLGAGPLIAVKAGRLLDPATGTVLVRPVILVDGRLIKSVGPDVQIPQGAKVVDLAGLTVLPGLMDCHTHVCEMVSGTGGFGLHYQSHYLVDTTLDRALQGVANLRSFLESGFTTLRDMGNAGEFADIALKKALRKGHIEGPRPYKGVIDRLKRAHRLGLPMAFGSDLIVDIPGYRRGPAALTLLQSWLDAGIPAGDILKAMTSDAARMLGFEKSRGAVRAGFVADLIAVEGDPQADILTLRKVRFVMKDGLVRKGPGPGDGD